MVRRRARTTPTTTQSNPSNTQRKNTVDPRSAAGVSEAPATAPIRKAGEVACVETSGRRDVDETAGLAMTRRPVR